MHPPARATSAIWSGRAEFIARFIPIPDVFAIELERIFARAWVYVGHESQVPRPCD